MVPPRKDCASNEALTTTRRDVLTRCGITRKYICAFVTGIFVTEQ